MLKETNVGSAASSDFKISLNLAQPKRRVRQTKEKTSKSKLEPDVLNAVDGVAKESANSVEAKVDLIKKLESVAAETELARKGQIAANKEASKNLTSILSELKVETKKQTAREPLSMKGKLPSREQKYSLVDSLFTAKPLGIFRKDELSAGETPQLSTWANLHAKELKLILTHPPANGFEEMIQWTEQGKLWKFPINNEQGLEEEAQVGFYEHVFLERHLEPWCPKRGPIRVFMELVCTGLSKNPYLTVKRKMEHIEWFRNYFDQKRKVLVEVNAIPENHKFQAASLS
nr:EOG090X04UC [Eulimnadia texana]